MLIYNTTFHVSGERERSRFLDFMYEEYIPQALTSPHLKGTRFVSLITSIGDDVSGFALMSDVENVVALKHWKQETENALLSRLAARFGESVLTFSTAMKVLDLP